MHLAAKGVMSGSDEAARLEALRRYDILDSPAEGAFDDLAILASQVCDTPVALVNFVDEQRAWFKSRVGMPASEISRDAAICQYTLAEEDLLVVPDLAADSRFARNPLVVGEPRFRFYAGAPLRTPDGHALGTLCVLDTRPRELTETQLGALRILSRQVMAQLELKRHSRELERSEGLLLKVFSNCPVALSINRFNERTFTDVNTAFTTLTGWTREEVLGKTVIELGLVEENAAGSIRLALEERPDIGADLRIMCRDGGWRDVLMSSVLVNVRGETHAVSTFVDITERKRGEDDLLASEDRLRRSDERLRLVARATNDAVWDWDLRTNAVWRNDSYKSLFGHAGGAPVPQVGGWAEHIHPDDAGRVIPLLHAAINGTAETWSDEYRFVRHDGSVAHVFDRGYIIRDEDGVPIRMIGAMQDVTARKEAERETARLASRLMLATDVAGIGVWDWDMESDEWVSSDAYSTMLGFEPAMGQGDRDFWLKRLHPEDRAHVNAHIRDVRDGKVTSYAYEARMQHADGQWRWVAVSARVVGEDAAGNPRRVLGVRTDITPRKEAELQVHRLNRVHAVLSAINQAIVRLTDGPSTLQAACDIAVGSGQLAMAWIGMLPPGGGKLAIVAHAGASSDTMALLRALVGAEKCVFTVDALLSGDHAVCNDIATDPAAQSWREAALERGYRSMVALPLVMSGRICGTFNLYSSERGFFDSEELALLDDLALDIGFALEVSERQAERVRIGRALAESEDRFRQLAENIQEVFWMTDVGTGRVLYVSPAYEVVWGRTCASLYEGGPGSWLETIHHEDRARATAAHQAMPTTGEYDVAYRIVRPDDSVRWIHDRGFPVRDAAGKVIRVVGTAADITEERQLEEQVRHSQKMEAVGQLAGGVAHDFNNILAVIMMQTELALLDDAVPTDVAALLEDIKSATGRAANLTRQLLAFGRRQVMQLRELDLNELVHALTRMLSRILGADIEMVLNIEPQTLLVYADAGMLDQVLMNLVVNARDAMPNGGVLFIETHVTTLTGAEMPHFPEATPGRYACLRVRDIGSGIAPDQLGRIFEPFYTTKEPGKGTGLGLATVFGIVRQHGGSIRVMSTVGFGTTFEVLLPVATGSATPASPQRRSQPRGGTETIFLVEDEPALRSLTRMILQRAGYTVIEAADATSAMIVWERESERIDLLLTDIVMPGGVSGRELAERLKALKPSLPVVFTSGYSAEISGRGLMLEEGWNFVQKPSPPGRVLETVRRALDR